MSLEESIKANRERIAKRKSFGEEGRKRFEKEVGGPAFAHKAKSKALEGMKYNNKEVIERLSKDKSPRKKQVGSYF